MVAAAVVAAAADDVDEERPRDISEIVLKRESEADVPQSDEEAATSNPATQKMKSPAGLMVEKIASKLEKELELQASQAKEEAQEAPKEEGTED